MPSTIRTSSSTPSLRLGIRRPILLNGKADEMMYERGELAGDLPFAQLKEREHINAAARAADRDRDFSQLIRQGRLGLFSLFLLTVFGAEGSGQIIAVV